MLDKEIPLDVGEHLQGEGVSRQRSIEIDAQVENRS